MNARHNKGIAEHQCRSLLPIPRLASNRADLNRALASCWAVDVLTVIRGGTI